MKLYCTKCNKEQTIIVNPSGPHLKASCSKCGKFIKFMSKEDKIIYHNEIDDGHEL